MGKERLGSALDIVVAACTDQGQSSQTGCPFWQHAQTKDRAC